jgi:hypothetical protein
MSGLRILDELPPVGAKPQRIRPEIVAALERARANPGKWVEVDPNGAPATRCASRYRAYVRLGRLSKVATRQGAVFIRWDGAA